MKKRASLKIEGMHCAGCVTAIQSYLCDLEGVEKCEVNLATNKAFIEYDDSKIDLKNIEKAIEDVGYKVVYERITLRLEKITEVDAYVIEKRLKHEGIKNVSVNHLTSQVSITYNPVLISLRDIRERLEDQGYKVIDEDILVKEDQELKNLKRLSIIGIILTIPVIVYTYQDYLSLDLSNELYKYIIFTFASVIQVLLGSRFYVGAYKAARLRSANMDTLIALGTTVAYLYSVYNTFLVLNKEHYYDVSSIILTLVTIGRYIENKMKNKTYNIIKKLLELQPKNARIVKDGEYKEIPIDLLRSNDLVLVKPGERIPLDGVIVEGTTTIDQSMITGEYMPVSKKEGDKVIGGTLNIDGTIIVRIEKEVQESLLSRIITLVEDAISRKPKIQRLVDKVAGYFTYIVITISLITFLGWYIYLNNLTTALLSAITVLIIACPCALGLATPTAVVVGMSKSAQHGVIFKSGEALELLSKTKVMVFDKTGTLTNGRLEVTDIIPIKDLSKNEILRIAASIEYLTKHPVAEAIVRKAEEYNLELSKVSNVRTIAGKGIKVILNDSLFLIGNMNFMIENGIDLSNCKFIINKLEEEGKTVVILASNKEVLGIFGLSDSIRKEARDVIVNLKELGIRCVMLTGDNPSTANRIASELLIDEVKANLLPDEKVKYVRLFKREGITCMVGDGINDAPALIEADVGIAITNATDLTIESADVILIKNNLYDILYAYYISKKTIQKVKHNLFYAFIYNVMLIPLAALGMVYPTLAAFAMAASSISVTLSSLTLKYWKPKLRL